MAKKFGEWSVWFGRIPINCWFPKYSYFDGGCYEKKAIIWLGLIVEFSRAKEDRTVYDHISTEELGKILDEIKNGDKYYD